jgi:hypothetical protein
MKCAKHGNDITNLPNKEQFGTGWLCRYAIWDSQTVNDLFLKQDAQDEYQTRKANPPAKLQSLRDFMATKPTDEELIVFLKNLKS